MIDVPRDRPTFPTELILFLRSQVALFRFPKALLTSRDEMKRRLRVGLGSLAGHPHTNMGAERERKGGGGANDRCNLHRKKKGDKKRKGNLSFHFYDATLVLFESDFLTQE